MPAVVAWAATAVAEFVGDALLLAGVAAPTADAIATATLYITEASIYTAGALALQPHIPHPDIGKVNLRQTVGPRRAGYGRVRLSGTYLLWEAKNCFWDALYLCQGPIDAFENYYFNDDLVSVNASTHQVEDTFIDHRYIRSGQGLTVLTNKGLATETSFASLGISVAGETFASLGSTVWTSNHRGDGFASMAVIGQPVQQKDLAGYLPNGTPTVTVSARILKVFDWRDNTQDRTNPATWKWSDNPVLAYVHYECWAEHGDQSDYMKRIYPSLSAWTDAANICDQTVTVVNASTYLTAKAAKNAASFTVNDATGVSIGTVIHLGDPAETVTVSGVSGNVISIASTHTQYPHNPGAPATWAVTAGTVFEKRYRIGLQYTYDNSPADIRRLILESFDGWVGEAGDGSLVCYAGAYYSPTVTIDANGGHILGFSYSKFTPDENAVNELIPSYTSIANQYSEVQCDTWQAAADIAARGVVRTQPLKLLQVQALSQARRLAKRRMSKLSAQPQGTFTTDLYGLNALGQRFLNLNIPDVSSLTNIPVEIIQAPKIDLVAGTVGFTFIKADPNVDNWNATTEEGASPVAPNTAVINPISVPVINSVSQFFDTSGVGGDMVRLHVQITDPLRSDYAYAVRWQVVGDTQWTEHSYGEAVGDGVHVVLDTGFVPGANALHVQVQFISAGGRSDWTASTNFTTTTSGATLPPVASAVPWTGVTDPAGTRPGNNATMGSNLVMKSNFNDGSIA